MALSILGGLMPVGALSPAGALVAPGALIASGAANPLGAPRGSAAPVPLTADTGALLLGPSLALPWVLAAMVGLLVIAIAIGVLLGRRGRHRTADAHDAAAVARAEEVRALPSFARAVRRRRAALAGIVGLGLATALLAGVVAARPMAPQTIQPVSHNRDIMLCLDVSGSMRDVTTEVLAVFEELLDGFEGERIGLTIFNSSPVQVFPLTDDYAFVRTHLASIRESFDFRDEIPEHWVGTLNGAGASLIGDGLAACALRFDHLDSERSRSIIMATDNEPAGAPIVSLQEAAHFAASGGIRVFTINPVAATDEELSAAAEVTGGRGFALSDATTVTAIVAEVQASDATEIRGMTQVVWTDEPMLPLALLAPFALVLLVLIWRVRL